MNVFINERTRRRKISLVCLFLLTVMATLAAVPVCCDEDCSTDADCSAGCGVCSMPIIQAAGMMPSVHLVTFDHVNGATTFVTEHAFLEILHVPRLRG
jgi:hypothetical protein